MKANSAAPRDRVRLPPAASAFAAGPGLVRLSLIDGFTLTVDGRPVPLRGAKPRALLAALALAETPAGMSRVRLAALLWEAAPLERGLASLRQCLRATRAGLDAAGVGDALQVERDALRIDLGRVETDLRDVIAAAEAGWPHPLLLGGSNPFERAFPGSRLESAGFEAWLGERRRALAAQAARGLEAGIAAPARGAAERRDLALGLAALDPTHEGAVRALMRAHVELGETRRALEAYDALWRRLEELRDAEPSEETAALARSLALPETGRPHARTAAAAPASRPTLTLAAIAAADHARPAAEGARLHLAARLAAERAWRVASEDLGGALFRLEGALAEEAGGRRALSLLLLDAQGEVVGSAAVRLAAGDWAGPLDAAAARLAAALSARLAEEARAAGDAGAAGALAARARALVESLGRDALLGALDLAAASPDTPRLAADAGAAALLVRIARDGAAPTRADVVELASAADRAVAADPLDAGARRGLSWARLFEREAAAAADGFALAVALHPTDPATLAEAALGLALAGATAEAAAALDAPSPEISPPPFRRLVRALAAHALGRCAEEGAETAALAAGGDLPAALARLRAATGG